MFEKKFIKVEGLVHKEESWTEDEYNSFTDDIIELVEEYEGLAGIGFSLQTESEVEEELEQNNIVLKFKSHADRLRWVAWYNQQGERQSNCFINYDLDKDMPWQKEEEQDMEFEMVFK